MTALLSLITSAVGFVIMLLVRGVASLVAMGVASRLWRRVSALQGPVPARPFTLLLVPAWAALLGLVLLLASLTRLPPFLPNLGAARGFGSGLWAVMTWLGPWAVVVGAPVAGVLLGLWIGARVHVYTTRWGRVMMNTRGRYLVAWLVTVAFAVAFRILPDGWLSTPTLGLASLTTFMVLAAHALIYVRVKQLQLQPHQAVPGPRIDLRLDPDEAAVVAVLAERWAAQGGEGAISAQQVLAGLRSRERLRGDLALAVLPGVRAAWEALLDKPERVEKVLAGLAGNPRRGVLLPGYQPGPQLERLLRMGGMARTVTLGRVRYTADGAGVEALSTAVLAQAGRTNLLFESGGVAVSMAEVDAVGMLASLQAVYRPAG